MPVDKLYHYCSTETAMKILSSKELWLCSAGNMNDHKEIVWTTDKLEKLIRQNTQWPQFHDQLLAYIFELFFHTPFVGSLSSVGDQLSQWRAYANDGRGFAIGFDIRCFPDAGKIESALPGTLEKPGWDNHTFLKEVIYR